ncbi:MAG: hypothetical protein LBK23_11085 [Oscillospiraceae bacterium]|jgi:hypothetical protein|nr:hypothetical protein [Oscillospiraceae bacterium]
MLKLIMGLKGSGKTKQFIELVDSALKEESGNIVCIEKGKRLTFDIPHAVRLVETEDYGITSFDFLKGFISGLRAGNYDITHIFIDSVLRLIGAGLGPEAEDFFDWCEAFGEREGVRLTMMVSADLSEATERVRKYI